MDCNAKARSFAQDESAGWVGSARHQNWGSLRRHGEQPSEVATHAAAHRRGVRTRSGYRQRALGCEFRWRVCSPGQDRKAAQVVEPHAPPRDGGPCRGPAGPHQPAARAHLTSPEFQFMADEALRALERSLQTSEDEARLLIHALRAGQVEVEGLMLAAVLGHDAARQATYPDDHWPLFFSDEWAHAVAQFGLEAAVRVVLAWGRQRQQGPCRGLDAAERWLTASSADAAAEAVEAARDEANQAVSPWARLGVLFFADGYLGSELAYLCRQHGGPEEPTSVVSRGIRAAVVPRALRFGAGNLGSPSPWRGFAKVALRSPALRGLPRTRLWR